MKADLKADGETRTGMLIISIIDILLSGGIDTVCITPKQVQAN